MHSDSKQTLRKTYLDKRKALDSGFARIVSRIVITHVLSLLEGEEIVAGYSAIRGELDVSTLMKVLDERKHTQCLPAVVKSSLLSTEKKMIFRQWKPGDALEKDAYNIDTPAKSAKATNPDVLLVPLVAFDKKGNRLGYGAGYYDRTIRWLKKKNPKLKTIGIAFSAQEAEKIPAETHDQKLDIIITEQGIIRCLK